MITDMNRTSQYSLKFNAFASLLIALITLLVPNNSVKAISILIPMDESQTDHLKAYGITFNALRDGFKGEWLLNYRGGSFLLDATDVILDRCLTAGVIAERVTSDQVNDIRRTIESENMERVELEKAPRIAVYQPPNQQPWDDAVTLALTYAEIKYDQIWDEEVLTGKLEEYDWLHCHHEDFSGQYGKFYASFKDQLWYQVDVQTNETMARKMGFAKVSKMKGEVARTIAEFVRRGGFFFTMCSAPETIDMALAAEGVDIVPPEFDGDPVDPNATAKLDYTKTFAFENFTPNFDPYMYRRSNIDTYPERQVRFSSEKDDFFYLFEFAAKLDPVPTMLTQCHTNTVNGFMGQLTAFRKSFVKKHVIFLAQPDNFDETRYLHGGFGRGTFTFLSGHDPEDYQHQIHDPVTDLRLHKNSPGYRLILNNVLFPAAKKKERKT